MSRVYNIGKVPAYVIADAYGTPQEQIEHRDNPEQFLTQLMQSEALKAADAK